MKFGLPSKRSSVHRRRSARPVPPRVRTGRARRTLSRRALVGLWAAAATGLAGGLTATTENFSVPVIAAVQDAASLIRGRSPGQRGPVSLLKGKGKGKFRALPSERALAASRAPAPDALPVPLLAAGQPFLDAPELAFAFGPPLLAELPAFGVAAPGFAAVFPGLPVLVGGIGGGVGVIGGGGGGGVTPPPTGGGGTTPPPTPAPPPVVTPAIPEPGTWATMLTGFGMVGWALRRRRRSERVSTGGRAPLPA